MATIKRFEDLEIWQLARQLCKKVYDLTEKNKFKKDLNLKSQIKNASGSVMDNISEGFGRGGNKEFIYFLSISIASCNEVQSQLYRSFDWNYITKKEFNDCFKLTEQIISKSGSLINYLNQSEHRGQKFKKIKK